MHGQQGQKQRPHAPGCFVRLVGGPARWAGTRLPACLPGVGLGCGGRAHVADPEVFVRADRPQGGPVRVIQTLPTDLTVQSCDLSHRAWLMQMWGCGMGGRGSGLVGVGLVGWRGSRGCQRPVVNRVPALGFAAAQGVLGVDTERGPLRRVSARPARQPCWWPAPVPLRPVRDRQSTRRPDPPRSRPADPLGQVCRCRRGRHRRPRLHQREDPREAQPARAIPAALLRHLTGKGPAGVDGRWTRPERCRGRPHAAPCPVMMPRVSRADDAPSGTQSRDVTAPTSYD